MFKKIAEFFKVKTDSAMIKHTTVQDHYESAALKIIEEIDKLRRRHVEAKGNINRLEQLASDKDTARAKIDRDILELRRTSPEADVSTRIKLALVYKHSADQFRKKAIAEKELMQEIESTVRTLCFKKDDLAVKLELIRERQSASEAGLENVDDIIQSSELVEVDVETILNKIQVFKGEDTSSAVIGSGEMADYLANLEAKA